jgi:hypothetical protein
MITSDEADSLLAGLQLPSRRPPTCGRKRPECQYQDTRIRAGRAGSHHVHLGLASQKSEAFGNSRNHRLGPNT